MSYLDKMRKASVAIYLACEESVAEDISEMLQWSANRLEVNSEDINKLEAENKTLKEVLEFYASKDNWGENELCPGTYTCFDAEKVGGKKAREVLK